MKGGEIYWRDCLSHRFFWFGSERGDETSSDRSAASAGVSFKRPWHRRDVVVIYNPFTNSLVTKRIVGVGGDTVRVFGEYAREYHAAAAAIVENGEDDDGDQRKDECGVLHDPRFPVPFCQRRALLLEEQDEAATPDNAENFTSKHDITMVVPQNH
eukprot:CAMPEP_0172537250 /NCGR_PEP_ID=MMETSP1067-20121228/8880_1 /TAXON_ID=265564 ORGANISM="Thalassiosira punctigera, Strain Tpunct2005C2" /NCGR_SAMPLE_ID=MMETSP1067 /ASSEMBLY_ACC=CAM_ASM_000444 /LENGTH=155 /DNA_ID=CAMNT_0013322505 /DNA_START=36 /DNA_END=500 /DNA_ORIENTATION=+